MKLVPGYTERARDRQRNKTRLDGAMSKKILFALILIICFLLTFYSQQTYHYITTIPNCMYFFGKCTYDAIEKPKVKARLTETDLKVIEIFNKINETIPNVGFSDKNRTTSAANSQATIINPKDTYCVGDNLTVQLDVYDFYGNRKKYGGDFLLARIYSKEIRAGASGVIIDLKNGTYHVHFALHWPGNVQVSLMLMHSSEGVSAIWRARNKDYGKVHWIGKFVNVTGDVYTECKLQFNTTEEFCQYPNHDDDGELFYCVKPANVPCDALTEIASQPLKHSYLSTLEKSLLQRSNYAVEVKKLFGNITVLKCTQRSTFGYDKCKTGMTSPFPSGYYFRNEWQPLFCNLSSYETEEMRGPCLNGKLIYLIGDSTMRQWFLYFINNFKGLKTFDLHGYDWHQDLLALDMDRNLQILWKKHGHPFLSPSVFPISNVAYVTKQIDELVGGNYTVVALSLGLHFRCFPLEVFIRRLINVRKAVERLLRRSPQTKIIVKTENTRELETDQELFSDFHGYIQYRVIKYIFQGIDIGLIDAWDMSIAFASQHCHPSVYVIRNQISLFLAYIC